MEDKKLLLFDYDGVIADSFDALLEVCVEAQAALGAGRVPTPEDFRTIENLTFDDLGRLIGLPEGQRAAYGEQVMAIQNRGWQPRFFPAVIDVMLELAKWSTIAVVTNSQSDSVAAALDSFGLGAVLSGVLGGESGATKADRIGSLQEEYGCPGARTYMIGDTMGDIRAGKQAGVNTVAVTWGFQARERLLKESPDHLLDRPDELLSISRGATT